MFDGPDRPRPELGEPVGPEDLFFSPGDDEWDPRPIATRLIGREEVFGDLRNGEATVLFLMRVEQKSKSGRAILGEMCLPRFGGTLGHVGTWMLARLCDGIPDFIMVLDAAWWEQAPPQQREALVFHELLHGRHARDKEGELRFTPEGLPCWDIRPHSIEEFDEVVERYGAWQPDVQRFISALRKGGAI